VSSSTGGADGANASTVIAASYAGIRQPLPASSPPGARGKNVWLITCPSFEGCRRIDNGILAAAKVLGWHVNVVDSKADPSTTATDIQDAISAKADGVIEVAVDCPSIKSALEAAKAAHVPVLGYALDCNYSGFGGGQPLFAASMKLLGTPNLAVFQAEESKLAADFMLARATQMGIKNPRILEATETAIALDQGGNQGFQKELAAQCSGCTIYKLPFTDAQLAAGQGQSIYKSGFLAHPDAQLFYYNFDAQLSLGLEAALEAAAPRLKLICCGDGGMLGLENSRAGGGKYVTESMPLDQAGWAEIDTLNRIFAGETQSHLPSEGGVTFFVDAQHNAPPQNQYALGPVKYQLAYAQLWRR
jgi:ribose transport system substrate-binding protein